jgi:protein-S-isoprenylcysteine O-methyltransferase Ste14
MNLIYHWFFPVVWWTFVAYWLISAAWVKRIKTIESPAARIFHLGAHVLAVMLVASHWFRGPFQWQLWPQNKFTFFAGAALMLAGLGFAVWARIHLGQYWSGSVALKEGHRLIRTGPYALVRHPIYTGLLAGVAGTAIALGQLRGVLALVLLLFIYLWKSRREERLLMGEFGGEYIQYRAEVPALAPLPRWLNKREVLL